MQQNLAYFALECTYGIANRSALLTNSKPTKSRSENFGGFYIDILPYFALQWTYGITYRSPLCNNSEHKSRAAKILDFYIELSPALP